MGASLERNVHICSVTQHMIDQTESSENLLTQIIKLLDKAVWVSWLLFIYSPIWFSHNEKSNYYNKIIITINLLTVKSVLIYSLHCSFYLDTNIFQLYINKQI